MSEIRNILESVEEQGQINAGKAPKKYLSHYSPKLAEEKIEKIINEILDMKEKEVLDAVIKRIKDNYTGTEIEKCIPVKPPKVARAIITEIEQMKDKLRSE